jgi:hypothetical protein
MSIYQILANRVYEAINRLSVSQNDIIKNGLYCHYYIDRWGKKRKIDIALKGNQRIVTYNILSSKTLSTKDRIRKSLARLERQGLIKLDKLYRSEGDRVTGEIICHIVTLLPMVGVEIKKLSLEKRKKEFKYYPQKNATPTAYMNTSKGGESTTLNIGNISNNELDICELLPQGLNLKSKDFEILEDEEKMKIKEYLKFEEEAKQTQRKIRTLRKQQKSGFKKYLKLILIVKKQESINQTVNHMSKETYKNQIAKSSDFAPQGREVRLDNRDELRAIKVDQDNLIPAKYKNAYLGMNELKKQQTIQLYKELYLEIGIIMLIEKQKFIRSIMKRYFEGSLSFDTIEYYINEVRAIKVSHYKDNRVIFDYWGLFVSKVGVIGNKREVFEVGC